MLAPNPRAAATPSAACAATRPAESSGMKYTAADPAAARTNPSAAIVLGAPRS